MNKTSWKEKLRKKWGLKNTFEVFVVLLVFACTGFSVMLLKRPILGLWSEAVKDSTLFNTIYYLLIFPIYNVLLLFFGFLFGKFSFFWDFEMKTFRKLAQLFKRSKN